MADSSLSAALKEAYAAAPQNVVVLHTLELRHPSFIDDVGQPIALRVVMDHADLEAKLEDDAPQNAGEYVTFINFSFDMQPPNVEEVATPELVVTIDNVSREIEDNIAYAVASPYPVGITYRPYLSTDLTQPQMDPPLHLTSQGAIEVDDFRVTMRATFGDMANRQFPNEDYTVERFPGLTR